MKTVFLNALNNFLYISLFLGNIIIFFENVLNIIFLDPYKESDKFFLRNKNYQFIIIFDFIISNKKNRRFYRVFL